jgi:hypothetical protein
VKQRYLLSLKETIFPFLAGVMAQFLLGDEVIYAELIDCIIDLLFNFYDFIMNIKIINDPAASCGVSKVRWYAANCGELDP